MASYLLRPIVNPILPWEKDEQETSRFNRILVAILFFTLILSAIIPFITIEKPDRSKPTSIPPRLVKMVLEQKKKEVVPPPPVEIPKEEEKEPEKKPEEPKPEKKTAKEVAKKHIAVFDALADLRDPDDMQDLKNNQSLSNDQGKAATVTRSLITKNATQGSGGIKVATASRSTGTGALAGQNSTNVKSEIGEAVANTKRVNKSGVSKRSSENIQLAFDKYKSQIDSLYQRALRKDPTLQGTVTFNLEILADGSVTKCSIAASQLNNPELEKRLIRRIKKINFGSLNVAVWKNSYTINFFPS
jgi:outer membrane biosynthesis protein TonB